MAAAAAAGAELVAGLVVAAGVGVASMKARIEDLGGALEILPQRKGLLVRAAMPRRRARDALPPLQPIPRQDRFDPPEPSIAAE